MSCGKRYKVLIVEDDPNYSEPLKIHINKSEDFQVTAVTDSAIEAYKLVQTGLPDAVIVDLELNEGDGLKLLARIREDKDKLPIKPYLLVTTSYDSDTIKWTAQELADYFFRKQNKAYGPAEILDHLGFVSHHFYRNRKPEVKQIDSSLEKEKLIRRRIISELDQYYMSQSSPAKEYLIEAIYMVVNLSDYKLRNLKIGKIIAEVGKEFKKSQQSVNVGIHRLINTAFLRTDPEDLEKLYEPYVDIGKGAPVMKDFILYIARKIKDEDICL